jgi:hypothetical protein
MPDRPGRIFEALRGLVAVAAVLVALGALIQSAHTAPSEDKRTLAVEITQAAISAVDLGVLSSAVLDQFARQSPDQSPEFRTHLLSLAPVIGGEIETMMDDIVRLVARFYEDRFDLEELKQIRAFSTSAVGRKQSKLGAEFSGRFAVTMQQAMAQRGPALEARIKAELGKRGYKL